LEHAVSGLRGVFCSVLAPCLVAGCNGILGNGDRVVEVDDATVDAPSADAASDDTGAFADAGDAVVSRDAADAADTSEDAAAPDAPADAVDERCVSGETRCLLKLPPPMTPGTCYPPLWCSGVWTEPGVVFLQTCGDAGAWGNDVECTTTCIVPDGPYKGATAYGCAVCDAAVKCTTGGTCDRCP
jgi:hypothetical protein